MSHHRNTALTVMATDDLTDVQVRGFMLADSVIAGLAKRYVISDDCVWFVTDRRRIHEVACVNSPTAAALIAYECDCACFSNQHNCPHIIAEQVLRGEICVRGAA